MIQTLWREHYFILFFLQLISFKNIFQSINFEKQLPFLTIFFHYKALQVFVDIKTFRNFNQKKMIIQTVET